MTNDPYDRNAITLYAQDLISQDPNKPTRQRKFYNFPALENRAFH
jgi:hypothetical protein